MNDRVTYRTVSTGSRIMLWAYPALNILSGWVLLGPTADSPGFDFARSMSPVYGMRFWAVVFILVGMALLIARIIGERQILIETLVISAAWWGAWTAAFLANWWTYDPTARVPVRPGLFGVVLCGFAVVAHFASIWTTRVDRIWGK